VSIEFEGREVSAVVLDFNGTFYISNKEFQKRVWKDARLQLVQKTFEIEGETSVNGMVFGSRLEDFVQESIQNGWRVTFKRYGGTDEEFDAIINSVNLAEQLEFDQELADFIRELIEHVPVYLFSSSEMDRVFSSLEAVIGELAHELKENILSGDKMERARKPKREAYEEMAEKLGVDPKTTIYADNNWREADMAAELGFLTFLVHQEYQGIMNEHVVINLLAQMKDHLVFKEEAAQ
jgi:FMN phosphatase YigB (HAD superfamily)